MEGWRADWPVGPGGRQVGSPAAPSDGSPSLRRPSWRKEPPRDDALEKVVVVVVVVGAVVVVVRTSDGVVLVVVVVRVSFGCASPSFAAPASTAALARSGRGCPVEGWAPDHPTSAADGGTPSGADGEAACRC